MELKELRIRNYYHWEAEGKKYIYQIEAKDFTNDNYKNFEPIPITEDILLKCGGKKFPNAIIYNRFKLIFKEEYNYWYVVDSLSLTYLTKVEFLHEWQNFVYAKDSQELNINL